MAWTHAGFFEVVSSASLGGDQGAFYTPYILDLQKSSELLVGNLPGVADEHERNRSAAAEQRLRHVGNGSVHGGRDQSGE